jgi:hypothetical protein
MNNTGYSERISNGALKAVNLNGYCPFVLLIFPPLLTEIYMSVFLFFVH